MKKSLSRILLFCCLLLWNFSALLADSGDGWGLSLSGGSMKILNDSTGENFQTTNVYGLVVDYQWTMGDMLSLTAVASENGGEGIQPDQSDYKYYKTGYMGLELRFWLGAMFLGFHIGQYYLTWIASASEYSNIKQAAGNGYGLGFETDSGWILAAYQDQSGKFEFDDLPDQKTEGTSFMLGYRFK